MSTDATVKVREDFWLEAFSEGVNSVAVTVGMIPYVNTNGAYVRSEDAERVTPGRFYHELSKVMTTDWKWDMYFAGQEVSFSHTKDGIRYNVTFVKDRSENAKIARVLDGQLA